MKSGRPRTNCATLTLNWGPVGWLREPCTKVMCPSKVPGRPADEHPL
jgi:hypothetical protein